MKGMAERGTTRHEMDHKKDRSEMLEQHHEKTLWIYWCLIILGFWLMSTPLTFNYDVGVVNPSGGREVWLSLNERIQYMKYSDLISGFLLIVFGLRSLKADHPVSLWACCFIGVWLSFAPILFWAPTALSYYNDTLIGCLVMALTVLIPGMPNMIKYMKMGTSLPKGWSYNPSSWPQRWIMIVLGFFGWIVSRYLAAYQLGYMDSVWDPFFGEGTRKVLDSQMSHMLPISDAGLGSLAYTLEFLMGFMGSPSRWRTMPWMVTIFGILVIPLGLVHIFLVISQPVIVGYWCTFCLLAAAIMLPMLPLEVDEVIAMGQFIKRKVKQGESFWKVFWKGGSEEEDKEDEKNMLEAPKIYSFTEKPKEIFISSLWGMNFPKNLVGATFLGIVLTFLPSFFGASDTYSNVLQTTGLLVITFSVIAMGEPFRMVRYINVLFGFGLGIAAMILAPNNNLLTWFTLAFAVAVAGVSLPKGKITKSFGTWDKLIK